MAGTTSATRTSGNDSQTWSGGAAGAAWPSASPSTKPPAGNSAGTQMAARYQTGRTRQRSTCASRARTSVRPDSEAVAPRPARQTPRVARVRNAASGAGGVMRPRAARIGTPKQSQASAYAATKNQTRYFQLDL